VTFLDGYSSQMSSLQLVSSLEKLLCHSSRLQAKEALDEDEEQSEAAEEEDDDIVSDMVKGIQATIKQIVEEVNSFLQVRLARFEDTAILNYIHPCLLWSKREHVFCMRTICFLNTKNVESILINPNLG